MKFKKEIGIGIGIAIICALAMGGAYLHIKAEENRKISGAQEKFVNEVLSEYEKELATKGLADIKGDVQFLRVSYGDTWERRVVMTYHSQDIDQYYMTEYGSDVCVRFANMLKNMRTIRDSYCKEYIYEIEGQQISIDFDADYTQHFEVASDEHLYEINSYEGSLSLYIDNELIYFHDFVPTKSEPKKEETTKKPSYSYGSSKKKEEYPDDVYDVYEYSDAEDFYYDNYDDFFEYEEAEDYYNDAWSEY